MARRVLTILWSGNCDSPPENETVSIADLRCEVFNGRYIRRLLRYTHVELRAHHIDAAPQPLKACLAARMMSRWRCEVIEHDGHRINIGPIRILRMIAGTIRDLLASRSVLASANQTLAKLETSPNPTQLNLDARPIYLRTDEVYGLRSGGSVGHIAGVLNSLDEFGGAPIFVTTDRIPTVRDDMETHVLAPIPRFRGFRELPEINANSFDIASANKVIGDERPSFVYQRYSRFNYAGLSLSRHWSIPFVLEYNGSEVWIARNWGAPMKSEKLGERIELANLHGANVVVVVSQPMKDELVERGIDGDRILVNPNGVHPDRYCPSVDGDEVRERYGLNGMTVLGFIGTFGPWHGAEILADAFGRLIQQRPDLAEHVRLLLIGDGTHMEQVKQNIAKHQVDELAVLTGIVPQSEGPEHLAACDILVSPHVPNPDGTPFFGSPTKLFEYMAMGKCIVASDLDQIGEILEHDRTAWMVPPGDVDGLVAGLAAMIDKPDSRTRLGNAASEEVLARYTWQQHTQRIIDALRKRCP